MARQGGALPPIGGSEGLLVADPAFVPVSVSDPWFPVSGFWILVSGFWVSDSGSWGSWVPGTPCYSKPGKTGHNFFGFLPIRATKSRSRFPGFRHNVSGFLPSERARASFGPDPGPVIRSFRSQRSRQPGHTFRSWVPFRSIRCLVSVFFQ